MTIFKIIEDCPHIIIADAFMVLNDKLNRYINPVVFVSGGSDSDDVIDICSKIDTNKKLTYVFFNPGLEYQATKDHLYFLEQKYDIKIKRLKPNKPIPLVCRKYGVPFLSKYVSEMIMRLQKHNFKWEDKPFEELIKEYPNCKGALKWWCNKHIRRDGKIGTLNIGRDKWLKEFMIENPPDFLISNKCCYYGKKKPGEDYVKCNNVDLSIMGIRKAEGGIRSVKYKSCFSEGDGCDYYRPIFWFTNAIKKLYDFTYKVIHSRAYREYGLTRTGCVGCPYNNDFETELEIVANNEPKLYTAIIKIFGKSYDYTRRYREYARQRELNG